MWRGFDNLRMKNFIDCIEKLKWQSDTMENLFNKQNGESEDWWQKIQRIKWYLWEYSFNINIIFNILALKSYLLQIFVLNLCKNYKIYLLQSG